MSDLSNAPSEVIQVHEAMVRNAKERYGEEDFEILSPVYTREEETYPDYKPNGNWLVGANFEGMGPSLLFKKDENGGSGAWWYRYGYKEDQPMKSGLQEALGNAMCFFTG